MTFRIKPDREAESFIDAIIREVAALDDGDGLLSHPPVRESERPANLIPMEILEPRVKDVRWRLMWDLGARYVTCGVTWFPTRRNTPDYDPSHWMLVANCPDGQYTKPREVAASIKREADRLLDRDDDSYGSSPVHDVPAPYRNEPPAGYGREAKKTVLPDGTLGSRRKATGKEKRDSFKYYWKNRRNKLSAREELILTWSRMARRPKAARLKTSSD